MTLHDRIRAVVEERLTVARAAATGTGRWLVTRMEPYTDPLILAEMDESGETLQAVGTIDVEVDVQIHVSCADPADAILSAEHALGILQDHRDDGTGECPTCIHDTAPGESAHYDCRHWFVGHPCIEIRRLATRWRVEVDG